jgi:hypothetical protein
MTWRNRIRIARGAFCGGASLSGAYILCNLIDFLFPSEGMKVGWETLLPSLRFLGPWTFLSGLVETFLLGALFVMIIAPIYNLYFILRDKLEELQARRYNDRLKYF